MREKRIYPATEEWRGQPALAVRPRGTGPFYLAAIACTGVSVDTSWRYFGEELHIVEQHERPLLFAVLELALFSCGYAMRHNVRRVGADGRPGSPGPARWVAWALCGLSSYMALTMAGLGPGLARVLLGPVLGLIMLHLALGIEIKVRLGEARGTWARIGRELRERALSRLGLADDARPALERTRDRAADRAARLAATPGRVPFRRRRLARAVRASRVALDDRQKIRMLRQVAALKTLDSLERLRPSSPWVLPDAPRVSLVKVRPEPVPSVVGTPELTLANVERMVLAAIRASDERRRRAAASQDLPAGSSAGIETVRGWEQKRAQVSDAVAFVRAEWERTNMSVNAREVGAKFGRSESWGRDILKRAAAESPNGHKVTAGQ